MVKSLVDLCTAVCIRNVRDIHDVGSAPYTILRKILLKIDSAAHLRELEEKSPHIQGDDAECWIRLIKRDFPVEYNKEELQPSNPKSWHKVYAKYEKLDADRKNAASEKLSNAFKKIEQEKASNVTAIIKFDKKKFGKPPVGKSGSTGAMRWGGGSRTKITSAQSIMKKARREAGEVALRNKLSTPTGQLPVKQGQITKAPLGMRMEYEIKSLPQIPRIQAPQQRKKPQWELEQKEREARLLKAKNGTPTKRPTLISDDELEDGDDSEGLFDEKKPSTPTATSKASKPSAMSPDKSSVSRPAKPAPLNPLAKMKLGHAWKDKPMTLVPIESPASKPSSTTRTRIAPSDRPKESSPPTPATSPRAAASGSSGSEQPKPRPRPMKRKEPPSIFMKPKPKNRRMS
ncbi:RNA polymerase II transcription factor SIII subunit A-domain-containing protein [Hypoxylon cercidicola]|nr:RNA polymerase II transcription factor SIII subunit A-domain-containing protein [Hypoxylon cercidicola]